MIFFVFLQLNKIGEISFKNFFLELKWVLIFRKKQNTNVNKWNIIENRLEIREKTITAIVPACCLQIFIFIFLHHFMCSMKYFMLYYLWMSFLIIRFSSHEIWNIITFFHVLYSVFSTIKVLDERIILKSQKYIVNMYTIVPRK